MNKLKQLSIFSIMFLSLTQSPVLVAMEKSEKNESTGSTIKWGALGIGALLSLYGWRWLSEDAKQQIIGTLTNDKTLTALAVPAGVAAVWGLNTLVTDNSKEYILTRDAQALLALKNNEIWQANLLKVMVACVDAETKGREFSDKEIEHIVKTLEQQVSQVEDPFMWLCDEKIRNRFMKTEQAQSFGEVLEIYLIQYVIAVKDEMLACLTDEQEELKEVIEQKGLEALLTEKSLTKTQRQLLEAHLKLIKNMTEQLQAFLILTEKSASDKKAK